jgi:hypothetical protein
MVLAAIVLVTAADTSGAPENELDALMARVLERRKETWRVLHDYVVD